MLEGIDFPFTHDLNALRNLLPDSLTIRAEHAELAELTECAVLSRFPGEWPDPSAADVVRAAVAAESRRRGLRADGEPK